MSSLRVPQDMWQRQGQGWAVIVMPCPCPHELGVSWGGGFGQAGPVMSNHTTYSRIFLTGPYSHHLLPHLSLGLQQVGTALTTFKNLGWNCCHQEHTTSFAGQSLQCQIYLIEDYYCSELLSQKHIQYLIALYYITWHGIILPSFYR